MAELRVWDSPRLLPAPVLNRQQGMRRVLFGTLAGRAIVVGLAIKLLVVIVGAATAHAPAFPSIVDTVAGQREPAGAFNRRGRGRRLIS